jgi:hypothetical protein
MPKTDPTPGERANRAAPSDGEFENVDQLVEWLKDSPTPVAASALQAILSQRIRAAVEAERDACLDRFAEVECHCGICEEMKCERCYAIDAIRARGANL